MRERTEHQWNEGMNPKPTKTNETQSQEDTSELKHTEDTICTSRS